MYVLIGAWPTSYWGQPRSTEDIDFLILLSPDELKNLRSHAQNSSHFKIDTQWDEHNPMIRHQHLRLLFKDIHLDLSISKNSHESEIIKRRLKVPLDDFEIYMATAEDIILMKLLAGRPKDFQDAISIFVKQQNQLNHDYLRAWAKALSIYDELNWLYIQN